MSIEYLRDSSMLTRDAFGNYKAKAVAERCCASAAPLMIVAAILKTDWQQLFADVSEAGKDDRLTQQEAENFVKQLHQFADDETGAEVKIIDTAKLRAVLNLQEKAWDDDVTILMNGRLVHQLSLGQRSSAMLPLVALSEDVPLIIDQPEDNLDNRHVGKVLTRILAELKEKRQIILATHNPNIVVGGDAEQVIILSSSGARQAEVDDQGSIDDDKIIQAVIGIMEGGKEAFQARTRRYEAHLK